MAGQVFWKGVNGMLDREIASAMRFLIDSAGNPYAYYYSIPEQFRVPSIYFPQPNITTHGDTLSTYALEFNWCVAIFDVDTQSAHARAFDVLNALQRVKCVIPLVDEKGELTGRGFRIRDPSSRSIDENEKRLILKWRSPRPYHTPPKQIITERRIRMWVKSSYESAISQIGG